MRRLVSTLSLLLLLAGCGTSGGALDAGDGDGAIPVGADSDGDTIPDEVEGRALRLDTDGDGTPDYLDEDSDGDGISDRDEAGDDDPATDPRDSDLDTRPDYIDLDSDNNGYPDQIEGVGDFDLDRIPNYADLDDDNDLVRDEQELDGVLDPPADTDGDGRPNYRDPDSDNDLIMDGDEFGPDTDRDGLLDHEDRDTDADGIPDEIEAGDGDVFSPPVDSDGDTIPDFRDPDSDDDGLSDALENDLGLDPTRADSDGDGVTDLIERAAGTDPLDAMDNPRSLGDFVFVMPHMEAPMPPEDTLDFATSIAKADVYFLMDETGSMGSSIDSLKTGIADLITRIRAVIPDAWFGLGGFRDYPSGGYGSPGDLPYEHYLDVTNDTAMAMGAANASYEPAGGGDGPESHGQAVWSAVTGNALEGVPARADSRFGACPMGTFGYACFRDDAVPVIVLISDIQMHNGPMGAEPYSGIPGAVTYDQAVAQANANRVRITGIAQTSGFGGGARADLEALARDTGTVDNTGRPLVEDYMSGMISAAVVNNIQILAEQSRLDITAEFVDDPSDGVDTEAAFFDHLAANAMGDRVRGCTRRSAEDRDGDGVLDTFPSVTTDTRVCFDIFVRQNDTVAATTEPQIFRATVRVIGDGFTELDSRDVFFLVPPEPPMVGGPD
ncbi:MAG: hypothetical protein VYE22_27095 [Myxococcota bacterium]|nr:hypothetical protein [Myxococcota bacterium]